MNQFFQNICRLLSVPFAIFALQSVALAQPVIYPGFLTVENAYIDTSEGDMEKAKAYLTINNLGDEPIVLLDATSEISEGVTFYSAANEEIEHVEILPGQKLVMEPGGIHMAINALDAEIAEGDIEPFELLIRTGLVRGEYLEAYKPKGAFTGEKEREAGFENEKNYLVRLSVK